jgi:hypothetical protein
MNQPHNYTEDERIDAFARELAIILRRIKKQSSNKNSCQNSQPNKPGGRK